MENTRYKKGFPITYNKCRTDAVLHMLKNGPHLTMDSDQQKMRPRANTKCEVQYAWIYYWLAIGR